MTTEEKLDALLFEIRELENNGQPVIFDKLSYKICKLPEGERRGGWNTDLHEFDMLINKLEKDGFMNGKRDVFDRIVTAEGLLFEGYVKTKRRNMFSKRLKSFQTWAIVVGTVGAMIGSITLVILELLKK